jgi:hypothetical protein
VKYVSIRAHDKQFSIKRMCEVLEVSRSAYYDWQGRSGTRNQKRYGTAEGRNRYMQKKRSVGDGTTKEEPSRSAARDQNAHRPRFGRKLGIANRDVTRQVRIARFPGFEDPDERFVQLVNSVPAALSFVYTYPVALYRYLRGKLPPMWLTFTELCRVMALRQRELRSSVGFAKNTAAELS